jgi:hypothetical protein
MLAAALEACCMNRVARSRRGVVVEFGELIVTVADNQSTRLGHRKHTQVDTECLRLEFLLDQDG